MLLGQEILNLLRGQIWIGCHQFFNISLTRQVITHELMLGALTFVNEATDRDVRSAFIKLLGLLLSLGPLLLALGTDLSNSSRTLLSQLLRLSSLSGCVLPRLLLQLRHICLVTEKNHVKEARLGLSDLLYV